MYRSFIYTVLIYFSFFLSSCETQDVSSSNSTSSPTIATTKNSIVFLFFQIEKLTSGEEKVLHTGTKTTQGIMKGGAINNKPNVAGNLLISMLGINGEVLEERIIEDPLNPLMEVYAEEGLSKTKMTFNKAEFSVRFNQKGEVAAVTVQKITDNSKIKLITLKL
ncbi:hypothetical protein [Chryseobacterium sp. MP_3.2]|uniref:hypothetical protein n=1 Tax=Chryseobacterium sp. MP_3.2 TaxID=3071712 RepID=UPI002E099EB9|nr:hypothetical protein [Chryseobacterium sp. MP_3.2]